MAASVDKYRFTPHAILEMERRGIDRPIVERVLANPEQRYHVRLGRDVLQSRILFDDKVYLVRVFVDTKQEPAEVITAYRTSNVVKYWRGGA